MSVPRYLRLSAVGVAFAAGVYAASLGTAYFWGGAPKHRVETAWLIFGGLFLLAAAAQWRTGTDTVREPQAVGMSTLSMLAAGFAVFTFALYVPALGTGLLSDDFILVGWAADGHYFGSWGFLRPLPLWIWSFVVQYLGASSLALHALNIGLHGLNAALVVALARRLGLASATACVAGFLFACFPAAVEPVAWASGVQDLLMTTFCLTFVLACPADSRRGLGMVVGVVALVLALASKETAVVAPALAFVAWFRPSKTRNWRPIAAGAIVVAAYIPLRLYLVPVDQTFATWPSRYFVKELFSRLFSTLAVPFTREILAGFPILGIAAAWLSPGLLLAALRPRGDRHLLLEVMVRCALWSVLSVVPVWSLFFVSPDLQGARYLYLAACGWSIAVAALFVEGTRRWLGMVLTVVVVAVGMAGVRWHLQDWRRAAAVRDLVLASARSHLHDTPCATIGFVSIPDSFGGAYVFRNGFEEAMARGAAYPAKPMVGEAKEPNCTLKWDGESFRPVGR